MIQYFSYPDFDINLFYFINGKLSNDFFDTLMPYLRNKWLWLPLYVFVISSMFYWWKKKGWMVLFFFLLSFSAADFISASVLKPIIQRERPCNDVLVSETVELRVECGPGYSIPSAHATNHASMGFFLFLLFGGIANKARYGFLLWAFLVSFAQIYVGVHYPLDILLGWTLGILIGGGLFLLLKFYHKYFYKTRLIE